MTEQQFMERMHEKYDGVYDLSKTNFISMDSKVTFICPIHGEFQLNAKTAYRKKAGKCPKCFDLVRGKNAKHKHMTTDEFIEKANIKYNRKYDYSKVDMDNRREDGKVCIICHELDEDGNEHGEFWQKPSQHLFGKSCPKCGSKKKTTKSFIKESIALHGDKFTYDKTEYKDIFTPVIITCKKDHHDFSVTPHNHLKGRGCPYCSKSIGTTFEEFFNVSNKIHNGKYTYYPSEWKNKAHEVKVRITCPKHGDFWQEPYNHMHGSGCPSCNNSKLESEIFLLLRENDICFEVQKQYNWLGRQKLDFYLPQYNIAIECQGVQHFKPVEYFGGEATFKGIVERDKIKKELCEEHGIKLLYYSNLGIEYPYEVFENKQELIKHIC